MFKIRGVAQAFLAISLLCLGVAVHRGWLDGLDRRVDGNFPVLRTGGGMSWLQQVASWLTSAVNPRVLAPVTLIVAAVLPDRSGRSALRTVLPPVVLMSAAVLVVKVLLARPGPPGSPDVQWLGWWPSGHTATTLVCLASLAMFSGRRLLVLAAAVVTSLVAASLVVIHAHWLSDVVGALLLGLLVLICCRPRVDHAVAVTPPSPSP